MSPHFKDGDIVLVHAQTKVKIGEIGIFLINNDGYIKKEKKTDSFPSPLNMTIFILKKDRKLDAKDLSSALLKKMIIYYLYKNRVGNWLLKYLDLVAKLFKLISCKILDNV